jgi:hypothetical protein
VIGDGFSLSGVSLRDIVHQRDSSGIFRYLKVATKEAKKILHELVDSHILVPLKESDVHDIFSETRYVIADSSLSGYISEHYGLLNFVLDRMHLTWLADHPTKDEREWYMYYYGMPLTSNYFTYIKHLKAENVNCSNNQLEIYDQIIVKRIKEIRNNDTYNKIRSDYEALSNALKKTIEPLCNRVRIYRDFYNF